MFACFIYCEFTILPIFVSLQLSIEYATDFHCLNQSFSVYFNTSSQYSNSSCNSHLSCKKLQHKRAVWSLIIVYMLYLSLCAAKCVCLLRYVYTCKYACLLRYVSCAILINIHTYTACGQVDRCYIYTCSSRFQSRINLDSNLKFKPSRRWKSAVYIYIYIYFLLIIYCTVFQCTEASKL